MKRPEKRIHRLPEAVLDLAMPNRARVSQEQCAATECRRFFVHERVHDKKTECNRSAENFMFCADCDAAFEKRGKTDPAFAKAFQRSIYY